MTASGHFFMTTHGQLLMAANRTEDALRNRSSPSASRVLPSRDKLLFLEPGRSDPFKRRAQQPGHLSSLRKLFSMKFLSNAVQKSRREPNRQSARRGFGQIVVGHGLGQLVTLLTLPVLARLYSPEDYGVLSLILTLSTLIAPLALLGMDQAIVRPSQDDGVAPLIALGSLSLLTSGLILGCVLYFFPLGDFGSEELRTFVAFSLPLLMVVTGFHHLINQLIVRSGQYGSIGIRNGLQSVSISLSQLALAATVGIGWFNGLVMGALIGTLVGVLVTVRFATKYVRRVKWRECAQSFSRFWQYPLIFAPMNVIMLLAQQAPLLFVFSWHGAADAGQLGMAERIVSVPIALLGLAGGNIFVGELSHAMRERSGN